MIGCAVDVAFEYDDIIDVALDFDYVIVDTFDVDSIGLFPPWKSMVNFLHPWRSIISYSYRFSSFSYCTFCPNSGLIHLLVYAFPLANRLFLPTLSEKFLPREMGVEPVVGWIDLYMWRLSRQLLRRLLLLE